MSEFIKQKFRAKKTPFGTRLAFLEPSAVREVCSGIASGQKQWKKLMRMWQWIQQLKRLEKPAVVLTAAIALSAVLGSIEFHLVEAKLYDFRMTHGLAPKPDSGITIITLDDESTHRLNDFAPLPLDIHTRFLEKLEAYHPLAVGYVVNMNHVSQMNPEQFQKTWGDRFVQAALRFESRGIPFMLGTPFDVNGEILPPYPLSSLDHAIAVVHKDGNIFAQDKVTRRALTYLYDKPTFHISLAERSGKIPRDFRPTGNYSVPQIEGEYFFVKYHGQSSLTGSGYARVPFSAILEGTADPGLLNEKILLVGTLTKENPSDFALTPYSKLPFDNPKILIHANILDSIIRDTGIRVAPNWINWIITFAVTWMVLWTVLHWTPLWGVFGTIGLAGIVLIIGQLLFDGLGSINGLWIRESQPLIGIFLGYYLIVPYRLIREYKKRWQYQSLNQMLRQVEELKTNFLSLVTHDLKTPVARIQGLTETVLARAKGRLDTQDRENLATIISSTDELNHFITSLLELTKIESNRIRLNLVSKDVNPIIENAIAELGTSARTKNIQFILELEPLFPIRIDPSLISKVVKNIVDNAIKYSPEGSTVLIHSREQGEWIIISVEDRGIGIDPKDQPNLFGRFYRAKNETTARTPGTGLGLYLTRYFVEAHLGRVEFESSLGRGSVFRIYLPIAERTESDYHAFYSGARESSGQKPGLYFNLRRFLITKKTDKTKERSDV